MKEFDFQVLDTKVVEAGKRVYRSFSKQVQGDIHVPNNFQNGNNPDGLNMTLYVGIRKVGVAYKKFKEDAEYVYYGSRYDDTISGKLRVGKNFGFTKFPDMVTVAVQNCFHKAPKEFNLREDAQLVKFAMERNGVSMKMVRDECAEFIGVDRSKLPKDLESLKDKAEDDFLLNVCVIRALNQIGRLAPELSDGDKSYWVVPMPKGKASLVALVERCGKTLGVFGSI